MKKLIVAMAVILCIFTAAAVGLTYTGIRLSKGEKILPAEKIPGIDLSGTYDENDLLIETLTEEFDGVEITLPQISGLKNKAVQQKVNSDMHSRIYEKLEEFENIDHAGFYTRANFANTVSLSFSVSDGQRYEILCLNYELVNGNRLTLEDIFTPETDILAMVRQGFFEDFVTMGEYDRESGFTKYDENELYKTVKNYMAAEDRVFGFSPVGVYFYYGNRTGSVDMLGNAESIGIYSKYATDESIFERDGIGFDGAFTCSDTTSYKSLFSKIDYGLRESNLWCDITVWKPYVEEECPADKREAFERFQQEAQADFEQEVEPYRELALKNPDKFYILMMKPGVSMYTVRENTDGEYAPVFSQAAGVSRNTKLYEMPLELYESKYKAKLLEAYRYQYFAMAGGAYIDTAEDNEVVLTATSDEKLMNYISGVEYTDPQSVFKDDSYKEILHRECVEWMVGMGHTPEEAEKLSESLGYEVTGWGIRARMPDETEEIAFVSFSEFDKESLVFFD